MADPMLGNRGRITRGLFVLLGIFTLAIIFYGVKVALAWHVPDVEITSPNNGDTLSGTVEVDVDYSVSHGNVHTVELRIDGEVEQSVAVHQQSGSTTFNWVTSVEDNGARTMEVRAYTAAPPSDHFNSDTIVVTVANPVCNNDSDCEDSDPLTVDTCQNPGTPESVCLNVPCPVACDNDGDCEDGNDLTIDTCSDGGTCAAACSNVPCPVACNADGDCDDGDSLSIDSCLEPGTCDAACSNVPCAVACTSDSGCDDSNPLTIDTCTEAGTCEAACVNTPCPVACGNDSDCDDGNALTTDVCSDLGSCDAACSNTPCPVACNDDPGCDDGDPLTVDSCATPGTCDATCSNVPCDIACANNSDCDDGSESTSDTCSNAGTCSATCVNSECLVACTNDVGCEDGNALTIDTCNDAGTCDAECFHTAIECNTDADCSDGDDYTADVCTGGGSPAAACSHNAIACLSDADCDDGDETTADSCGNPGAVDSACVNTPVETEPEPEEPEAALTLDVTSPANGAILNTTNINVEGTTSPGARITINGIEGENLQGSFSVALTLSEGTNTIEVRVERGTETKTITLTVIVDTQPPEIYGMEPADGSDLEEAPAKIKVKIDDNPGGVGLDEGGIEVTINGGRAYGKYVLSNKEYEVPTSGLEPGTHIVTASASDKAGNKAPARTFTFTITAPAEPEPGVDNEPPHLEFTALPGIKEKPRTFWDNLPQPVVPSFEYLFEKLQPKQPEFELKFPGVHQLRGPAMPKVEPPTIEEVEPPKVPAEMQPDGEVEALAIDTDSGIDEESIVLKINGKKVGHTYDKKDGKIRYRPGKMKRGKHTVELTASDTEGNEESVSSTFILNPTINAFTLTNITTGENDIAEGDTFRIFVDTENPGITDLRAVLYNMETPSTEETDHWVGYEYDLVETAMPGDYEAYGIFYVSKDHAGYEAAQVYAAIPPESSGHPSYEFSDNSLNVSSQAWPAMTGAFLDNETYPGSRTIETGDDYSTGGTGSPGQQKPLAYLLNAENFMPDIGQSIVSMNYVPETSLGSGEYRTAPTQLTGVQDAGGNDAHALVTLFCPGLENNALCAFSAPLYVGDEPQQPGVVLINLDNPGSNTIQQGQPFRVEVDGAFGSHGTYLKGVLVNADRFGNWSWMDTLGWHGDQYNPFITESFYFYYDGAKYVYEGTLDNIHDGDGQQAGRIAAVVTLSNYFEYQVSNDMLVEAAALPNVSNVRFMNVDHPDWMTIAIGESFKVKADGDEGTSLDCVIMATVFVGGYEPVFLTSVPMVENEPGKYVCTGDVTDRPYVDGDPADFLIAVVVSGGNPVDLSDDILTYRENVQEVHFRNLSRDGAADIAVGERFEVSAVAAPGRTDIGGVLLNAAFLHEPGDPFQFAGTLEETPANSGNYRVEASLTSVPAGVEAIRAAVGEPNLPDLKPVISTEILTVGELPPLAPPVITSIDGVAVVDNEATSNSFEPVVTGEAEASSTVKIYEFIEGVSAGTIEQANPLDDPQRTVYIPQPGTVGDNFDDADYTDMWEAWGGGTWSIAQQNGVLEMSLGSGSIATVETKERYYFEDGFFLEVEVELPGAQNPDIEGGSFELAVQLADWLGAGGDLGFSWWVDSPTTSSVSLQEQGQSVDTVSFDVPSLDTVYTLKLEYDPATERVTLSISQEGGPEEVLIEHQVTVAQSLNLLRPRLSAWTQENPLFIRWDNFNTSIPLPEYEVYGPAMSLNGVNYDATAVWASPCDIDGGMKEMPYMTGCVTGEKDIYVFLVTIYDLTLPDGGQSVPEIKLTIYTSGTKNPEEDQVSYMTGLLDQIKSIGFFGDYSIDTYGVALEAPGVYGASYTLPSEPVAGYQQLCTATPGEPGYLRWDAAQGEYLASYTPLEYDGVKYADFIIWGLAENLDGPNVIFGPDAPIWWADGAEDISAGVIHSNTDGWDATGYATPGLLQNLPSEISLLARADHVLIKPADPTHATPDAEDDHYTWNQSALDAAGISVVGRETCTGGAFQLIAEATADASGTFATQTIPFEATGTHYLVGTAELGDQKSGYSDPVAYHLVEEGVDVTPPSIENFSVDPAYISPANNDGLNDEAHITADITDESGFWWKLSIRDAAGAVRSYPIVSNAGVDETWDGTSDSGTPVPDDIYTVSLYAIDELDYDIEETRTVIVDNEVPNVGIISPGSGQTVSGTVDVIIDAEDVGDAGIGSVMFWVVGGAPVEVTEVSGNRYTYHWDTTKVSNGYQTVTARAVDNAANFSDASVGVMVENDVTPPTITITYPEDGSYTNNPDVTIVADIEDNPGGSGLNFATLECVVTGNSCYIHSVVGTQVVMKFVQPFSHATHEISVQIKDNAGNLATEPLTVHVDLIEPDVRITSPTVEFTNNPQIPLTADITDDYSGVPEDGITVYLNEGSQTKQKDFTFDGTTVEVVHDVDLKEGVVYTFIVIAVDRAGNQKIADPAQFIVDKTPPFGAMNPVARPDSFTDTGEYDDDLDVFLTFNEIADNETGVMAYYAELFNDDDPPESMPDEVVETPGQDTDTAIKEGLNRYCVVAEDFAGNKSQVECDEITLGVVTPIVANISDEPDPISPKNVVAGEDTSDCTTINAEIYTYELDFWQIDIYSGSTHIVTLPVPGPGTGPIISEEWCGTDNGNHLDDGDYIYLITATNKLGFSNHPVGGTVTIDNQIPVVEITDPTNSSPSINQTTYPVEITVTENLEIEKVSFYVDGEYRGDAEFKEVLGPQVYKYVFNWNSGAEEKGKRKLTAKAVDTAKNTGESPIVEVTIPETPVADVWISSPGGGDAIRLSADVTVQFRGKPSEKTYKLELLISADGVTYTQALPIYKFSSPIPSNGEHTFVLDTTLYDDGTYYLKAKSYKNPGNSNLFSESAPVQVLIDNTLPTITEPQPPNGVRLKLTQETYSTPILATVSDENGSGIDTQNSYMEINGNRVGDLYIGPWEGKTVAGLGSKELAKGEYNVKLHIADKAGNEAALEWTFTVAPEPVIQAICPISGNAGSTVTITGENFPRESENWKVNFVQYTSSGLIKVEASVDPDSPPGTLIVTVPDNFLVSDPFLPAGQGLARIQIAIESITLDLFGILIPTEVTDTTYFQVTENPVPSTGLAYAVNRENTVNAIDPATNKVVAVITAPDFSLGSYKEITDVSVSREGDGVYVSSEEKLFVIDTACNTILSSRPDLPGYNLVQSTDGETLFMSTLDMELQAIDPDNLETEPRSVSGVGHTTAITPDGQSMYARAGAYMGKANIVKLDIQKILSDPLNAAVDNLTAPETDISVRDFKVSSDGRYVFVAFSDETNRAYDTGENKLKQTFPISATFIEITPDGEHLYAVSGNTLNIVDLELFFTDPESAVVSTAQFPLAPKSLKFADDGTKVYAVPYSKVPSPSDPNVEYYTIGVLDTQLLLTDPPNAFVNTIVGGPNEPLVMDIRPMEIPHIDSLSIESGSVGEELVISGTNFNENRVLNFVIINGAFAPVLEATETTLRVRIPAGAGAQGDVSVTTNWLTSNKVAFNVLPPTINAIYPQEGVFGQAVSIVGNGFSPEPGENIVSFNGVPAEVTYATTDALAVTVPYKATTGDVVVRVGTNESNALPFTITAPTVQIDSPQNNANFDPEVDTDSDGNPANGFQVNVEVSASQLPDETSIYLNAPDTFIGRLELETKLSGNLATFENVTLFPGENTLTAHATDLSGRYAENTITVTLAGEGPGAEKLAYACYGDCGIGQAEDAFSIFIKDLTANAPPVQVAGTEGGMHPSWHPDGTKIVFAKATDLQLSILSPKELYVADLESDTVRPLTLVSDPNEHIQAVMPVWSPDGTKIAYQGLISWGFGSGTDFKVIAVDSEGYSISDPLTVKEQGDSNLVKSLWSPNGKYLMLPPAVTDEQKNVSIVQIEGTNTLSIAKTLTGGLEYGGLEWVPGSSSIAGSTINGIGYSDILEPWLIPLPVYTSQIGEVIVDLSISPNGRKIAYQSIPTSGSPFFGGDIYAYDIINDSRTLIVSKSGSPDFLVPKSILNNSTPPSITNVLPYDGAFVNTQTPSITATIKDDKPFGVCEVESFSLIVDGNDEAANASFNELTGKLSWTPETPFALRHVVSFSIQATDCVGNTSGQVSGTFTINDPPEISNIKPEPGSATNNSTILFSATITDQDGINPESVKLTLDGKTYTGIYTVSLEQASIQLSLEEGTYSAAFEASDSHGYTVTEILDFTVDTTLPYFISMNPGQYPTTNTMPSVLSINIADDLSGFDGDPQKLYVKRIVSGKELLVDSQYTANTSTTGVLSHQPQVEFEEGHHVFRFHFGDRAGNFFEIPMLVTYDKSPPIINIEQPYRNGTVNYVYIKAEITDKYAGVDKENFSVKLRELPNGNWADCEGAKFLRNFIVCDPSLPTSLDPIDYEVQVTVNDNAGNQTTESWNFTLDSDAEITVAEVTSLGLTPRYFNPSAGESLTVSIELTKDSTIKVDFQPIHNDDVFGDSIKTLTGSCTALTVCELIWNGKDKNEKVVSDKSYRVLVTVIDGSGAQYSLEDIEQKGLAYTVEPIAETFNPAKNDFLYVNYFIDSEPSGVLGFAVPVGGQSDDVIEILEWEAKIPGENTEVWNGRKSDGSLIQSGQYEYGFYIKPLIRNSIVTYGNNPDIINLPDYPISITLGISDNITFTYDLTEPCNVTVMLIDQDGQVVTILENNVYKTTTTGNTVTLDGNSGFFAEQGNYAVKIDASDTEGNFAKPKYVNIEVMAPQIKTSLNDLIIVPTPGHNIISAYQDTDFLDVKRSENENVFRAELVNTEPAIYNFSVDFLNPLTGNTYQISKDIVFNGLIPFSANKQSFNPVNGETVSFSFENDNDDEFYAAVYQKTGEDPVSLADYDKFTALLVSKEFYTSGIHQDAFSWDGTRYDGQFASPGTYTVFLYPYSEEIEYGQKSVSIVELTIE